MSCVVWSPFIAPSHETIVTVFFEDSIGDVRLLPRKKTFLSWSSFSVFFSHVNVLWLQRKYVVSNDDIGEECVACMTVGNLLQSRVTKRRKEVTHPFHYECDINDTSILFVCPQSDYRSILSDFHEKLMRCWNQSMRRKTGHGKESGKGLWFSNWLSCRKQRHRIDLRTRKDPETWRGIKNLLSLLSSTEPSVELE